MKTASGLGRIIQSPRQNTWIFRPQRAALSCLDFFSTSAWQLN